MSRLLDGWQVRLEHHFEVLAESRAESGLDIFALEHGLDESIVSEISEGLRLRLKNGLQLSPHWLLWIIYLTEHGYRYEGDEFWLSFEQQTPCWNGRMRYQAKQWFNKFQSTYKGVVPTGRWADHFSIISRPIRHAILPKYLQVHFARTLYHQRHRLISLTPLDSREIGKRLAENAHYAPTLFQEFLQEEELTGRIVLALLGEYKVQGSEPIDSLTLQRIVRDLEKVRKSREWLQETRRYVKDRFVGIATGSPRREVAGSRGESSRRVRHQLDVKPKLYLSHHGGGRWIVWADIPSFKEIASLYVGMRQFLKTTRCRLNGSNDFKPGGWLLSRNRKSVLKWWPNPQKPMICFESSNAILENILQDECHTNSGPVWLYRIGRDGTAREITGGIVRPGFKYIIVMKKEQDQLRFGMRWIKVECAGIWAYRLDVPADVSSEFTEWLSNFKLLVARTTYVWPAGLPSRGWNGEGQSEWLTTEMPCFGMVNDYPVDGYILQLDSESEIKIESGACGDPVFVRLPRLSAGKHILTVKAKRSVALDQVVSSPVAEGYVELRVRNPEPWIPGVAMHCGLIANLDPHDPDLETFWRNEVKLSVIGPSSRSVTAKIRLMDRKGDEFLCEQVGDRIELPLRSEYWREIFDSFLRREKNAWAYLEAASGELEILAEELGRISFRFEHDVLPLRWILSRERNNIIARLVDDTGFEESEPEVSFFNIKSPLIEDHLSCDALIVGQAVEQPGGLLYAKHGDFEDFVVVSCKFIAKNFKEIGINSDYSQLQDNSVVLASTLRLYAKWHNARLYGPLVNFRWNKLKNKFLALIYEKICGQKWAEAEESLNNSRDSTPAFEAAINTLQTLVEKRSIGFSALLRSECEGLIGGIRHDSTWYSELAQKYQVCKDPTLSEFAFKLAMEAHRVPKNFENNLDKLLVAVQSNPSVLRGARFLQCVGSRTQQK